jgi:hypothetical protein
MTCEHEPKAAEVTVELEAALVDVVVRDDVPHDATVEGEHTAAGAIGDVDKVDGAHTDV